jgi:tetratricopeptide (TPR) repeat protein
MQKHLTLRFISAIMMVLAITNGWAQGVTLPRTPSPAATVSQTIGISSVKVKYSRPSVKNRVVWGELVPYGWNVQTFGAGNSAPWRAGANENTVIEFSHPAKVEGQDIPAGSYGLFFVINKDDTGEVILSKDSHSWGSFFYDEAQNLVRAKIQLRTVPQTEMLTYDFINNDKNSAELVLNWEKKQFPVKIAFAVDDIVMANLTSELKGSPGFSFQNFNQAAGYALQNNLNLEKALAWTDQSLAGGGNRMNTYNLRANILRKMGKTAEADKASADGLAIANENDLNNYGYQLLGQGQHDKAIEILTVCVQRYPKSANAWDSLGEAYATKGDKKNAVTNFKKSLTLNPTAGTKANSEKFLKQLGAM